MATDIPFVFDEKYPNVAGYTSDELERISKSSPDLTGVPSISSPSEIRVVESPLAINDSINQSNAQNNATVSDTILSLEYSLDEFIVLDQSLMDKEAITLFDVDLPPWYSQLITTLTYQDWFKEGNTKYDNEDYESALACYEQAIKLNPYFPGAWYNKGLTLFKMEKYHEALRAFNESLSIDPDYEKALNGKEEALRAIGRHNEVDAANSNEERPTGIMGNSS